MTLIVVTIASFCTGVFIGALIVSGKDKPLKKPLIEDWEYHWTKEQKHSV